MVVKPWAHAPSSPQHDHFLQESTMAARKEAAHGFTSAAAWPDARIGGRRCRRQASILPARLLHHFVIVSLALLCSCFLLVGLVSTSFLCSPFQHHLKTGGDLAERAVGRCSSNVQRMFSCIYIFWVRLMCKFYIRTTIHYPLSQFVFLVYFLAFF
ncbi:Os12g0250700 [Oryza sativa Japonica Group]|uniref:Os12g0250700 protein n=1 Tax=Oryza sativa subsp. japonica TaxID=39947 RepID=C7JA31_ORYSJ|nr:hypothetical protein DAI22_12g084600 [Oryza sativa Japonica Group]BAH95600.1 Os12g0250700 [Oryza sativa Japonica Group]|eukprot:NP_001176872.1 Os12g0250700 [Oryza sativa Japonica Group]